MSARIYPDFEQYQRAYAPGLALPICLELPADLETPVSAYLKLQAALRAPGQDRGFLLESVERGESLGRYSFIGAGIKRRIELHGKRFSLANGAVQQEEELADANPLDFIRQHLGLHKAAPGYELPALLGGAVGFLGYDLVRNFERLPSTKPDELGLPDGVLLLPETLVIFDHALRLIRIVALAPAESEDAKAAYEAAAGQIELVREALMRPLDSSVLQEIQGIAAQPVSSLGQSEYEAAVNAAKEYIAAGDVFQVVLSQRLSGETSAHPFQIYRALRILNPSPYMFYLDFGECKLIGSSPEVLVRLMDGEALLNPIAGTRPRGIDPAEDNALEAELLASEKERAEHVMLVDLARNDLGRTCATGTVAVPKFMQVERFSHVMHIVSNVTGQLNDGRDCYDLLQACFPAGTVSGAPKVRAMEIIEELEPVRRGLYSGAVGYFGANGDMDMCIAIRTLVMQGQRYYLQAGAGIVADSDPAAEYEETLAKMAALRQAIQLAEEGL